MKYQSMDLEVFEYQALDAGERFRVRVSHSPVGEQRVSDAESMVLRPEIRQRLARLERRKLGWAEIIDLGEELGKLLFPPRARSFLIRSIASLEEDQGLRLRLKLDTFALADLPWEYAYVPRSDTATGNRSSDGFLALDRRLSLVRYEVLGEKAGSLEPVGAGPLRLVALLANPSDPLYPQLDLDAERRNIEQALAHVPGVRAEFYPNATVATIEDALVDEAQVFHFAGHGTFEGDLGQAYGSAEGIGFIVLLDEEGRAYRFSAEHLARNLTGRGVRLAVLGACEAGRRDQVNAWTGVVPALTRAGIPAVLGMQYTIRDANATAFSQRFYRALAAGQPIDAAVTDGRLAIFNRSTNDERDWGVPVLYLRTEQDILFPKPLVTEERNTWNDVLIGAREQANRFLHELLGTPERPGNFIAEVYVPRAAEVDLDAFQNSPAPALIVSGESGMGKTNLLCHWIEQLLGSDHAVLAYNCARFISPDVERELARDLSLATSDEVLPALERIGQLAATRGRQFVIVFDAINEFHGSERSGPDALVKSIDALVARLPAANVRVLMSCNSAAWRQLERLGTTRLLGNSYFRPSNQPLLTVDLFTPDELATAYERYRAFFKLQTPQRAFSEALRERLRKPLLLRMLAETYKQAEVPTVSTGLGLRLFQRYYEERVRHRKDLLFVDALSAEMLRQRRGALRIDDLVHINELSQEILAENTDSSYYRLLDGGILIETSGDPLEGDTVRFAYLQVGAYALAVYLVRRVGSEAMLLSTLVTLAREARTFSLAWDIARTLLLIRKNPAVLAHLAQSTDVELRELTVEGLVEIYADAPDAAIDLIKQLLQLDSEEARRTGLKAAYYIGAGAREIFLWAAAKGSPALRQATKFTLYLIWRSDPDFTYDLLNDLVARIGLNALRDLRNMVEFAIDLPVTMYINHCDRQDLVEQITALHHEMYKNKLHLNLLNTGLLGPAFEKLIFQAIGAALTRPSLEVAVFSEIAPAESYFNLPPEAREDLRNIIPYLDPKADLRPAKEIIARLLSARITYFNVFGALALVVHAYGNLPATEPLLRELFDEIDDYGRLWLILGFAVVLPGTPPGWVPFLEELMGRLIAEHPDIYYNKGIRFLEGCDILLLPLGLAYGKRGEGMPFFETLLREGLREGKLEQVERCVIGLSSVGFYYPELVFQILRPLFADLNAAGLQNALVRTLSTMRVLHFNPVDLFLQQAGADEMFQRRVSAEADQEQVRRYIYWIGLHNYHANALLFHPWMRQQLVMEGVRMLCDATTPEDFVGPYTMMAVHAANEADWLFRNWTRRE